MVQSYLYQFHFFNPSPFPPWSGLFDSPLRREVAAVQSQTLAPDGGSEGKLLFVILTEPLFLVKNK